MNRRSLFSRFAAIVAAVALAPAVKAEALSANMGLIPGTPYPIAMLQGLTPPPLTFEALTGSDCGGGRIA